MKFLQLYAPDVIAVAFFLWVLIDGTPGPFGTFWTNVALAVRHGRRGETTRR